MLQITGFEISIHAPAWGATRRENDTAHRRSHFNPRARVGRDKWYEIPTKSMPYFNPRARVGRDLRANSPTSSMTLFQSTRPRGARLAIHVVMRCGFGISIHAPAWGATIRTPYPSSFVRFQSTRPRGARRPCKSGLSRFHVISIHAPAWGATIRTPYPSSFVRFQSTRPRGARRRSNRGNSGSPNFNPRARVGRDLIPPQPL